MITGGVVWLIADRPAEERRLSALFDLYTSDDPVYSIACLMDKKVQNRAAKSAFASFLQLPTENTRPSVLGTTQTYLRLFDSDLVRRLTDTTSIDIDALIAGAPLSLYIIVPPLRLTAYRPILRMWLSGLILALTQRKTPPSERTLMLCDEIGNLGKSIPSSRRHVYALVGADIMVVLAKCRPAADLRRASEHPCGQRRRGPGLRRRNQSMAQDIASLIGGISADEILRMPADEQILLVEGKTMRCKQIRHYNDKQLFGSVKS